MSRSPYIVTDLFEQELCAYTGAPYAVAVDNCSNAIFLALKWYGIVGKEISIPSHCYPSVPCEIIHAGGKVKFIESWPRLTGCYRLDPTTVYDSALRFTADMYVPGSLMCLSFTGPYKHLKLGKAGAILTDNLEALKWLKKARFSGRNECSYFDDNFDDNPVIGHNYYLLPEIAARGLMLMRQFYNLDGTKKHNEDITLPYPDLSKYKIFQS